MTRKIKEKMKKIVVVILILSVFIKPDNSIASRVKDKQQSYLILTDKQNVNKYMKKEIQQVFSDGIPLGLENGLYTIKATEEDVQQLDKREGIIVEPDIKVCALQKIDNQKFTNAIQSLYKSNWPKKATHSEKVKLGENKVKVAIMDSGLDVQSEIENVERVDFVEDYYNNTDATGHGTMITHIMSEHKTMFGHQGVIPENKSIDLVSLRVLDEHNQAPLSRILEALQWCIDNKVNVINMSFGTDVNSEALHYMIRKMAEHNILMIAAVGNQGEYVNGKVQYPAAYKEVVGVGSVNEHMEKSSFSSVGDGVSLMAPGENLPLNSYMNLIGVGSGTSFSAPYVTAIATAIWSLDSKKSADYVRRALEQGADYMGERRQYGYGVVNYERSYRLFITNQVGLNHQETLYSGRIQKYEVPQYVQGSWSYNLHQHLIVPTKLKGNKNKREVKGDDCKTIRSMSYYVDTNNRVKDYDVLHARKTTNYVSATKVLFEASRKWGGSFKTQEQLKNSMMQYVGAGTAEETTESIRQLKHIAEIATTKIIEQSESKKNICAYKDASKMTSAQINRGRMQLLGVAIHIAGDTYAYMTARYNKATANATAYLLENFVQNEPFTLYTFCPYQKDVNYPYKTKIWSTCMEKVDSKYKEHMAKYNAKKLDELSHK